LIIHTHIKNIYIAPRINSHSLLRSHHTSVNREVWSPRLKPWNVKSRARSADGRPFQTSGPAAEKLLSPNRADVRGVIQVLMSEERSVNGDSGVGNCSQVRRVRPAPHRWCRVPCWQWMRRTTCFSNSSSASLIRSTQQRSVNTLTAEPLLLRRINIT